MSVEPKGAIQWLPLDVFLNTVIEVYLPSFFDHYQIRAYLSRRLVTWSGPVSGQHFPKQATAYGSRRTRALIFH